MFFIMLWISLVGVVPLKVAYDWIADWFDDAPDGRPFGRGFDGVASRVAVVDLSKGGTRSR